MELTPSPAVQNELLDKKIEKTKQQFYQELARKKRNIKRHWMEINAVTNNHFLQQLPYRAMLNHLQDVTAERRKEFDRCQRTADETSSGSSHSHVTADNQEERLVLEDEFPSLPVTISGS